MPAARVFYISRVISNVFYNSVIHGLGFFYLLYDIEVI